ncbi:MAG TPA: glycosyltransferase family 2 protein [Vicinamibacterales bacterium]|jgi:cellulose synthase/poly-beta-1,6-N-acetylglucosamine synthase-like glycosyltransferase
MDTVVLIEAFFWTALAVTLYVYVGYPTLLAAWARLAPKPVHRSPVTPPISIIIAARNEAASLQARIENLLASDYPSELMQIIVVSDGSTDPTADILAFYKGQVDSVLLPPGGKACALNAGVEVATHDVLVFTDARQSFAPDALRALVAPLADPHVGGVSGELLLDCESGGGTSTIGEGVGAYWKYEKWLRKQESLIGSTLGSTGAIHALRRELWQPLPPETILDDVLAPMQVVLSGARVVFEGSARAYDRVAPEAAAEFQRKTRTLAGNYQILRLQPRLLLPFVNPVWLQFISHKLGRLLVPYALFLLFICSAALSARHPIYAVAFAGQVAFYGLAAYGAVLDRRGRAIEADIT